MKIRNTALFLFVTLMLSFTNCNNQAEFADNPAQQFTFAFITDIHLQPERNATEGFLKAINHLNQLNPNFVITGGDLIMDALGQSWSRADSLYNLYLETAKNLEVPVYNTMGNHEVYGFYKKSGADRDNPEFGEQMFLKRIGKNYYSFDHKGWHFIILDSVDEAEEGDAYIGNVGEEQMNWLREDLALVDPETPIVISTHIPLTTVFHQVTQDPFYQNAPNIVVKNTPEVLGLFENHNLKLVLQGHMHILEEIVVNGVTFVTGGAICGRWWTGPYHGVEEGYVQVNVAGDDFDWQYVDYGWEVGGWGLQ